MAGWHVEVWQVGMALEQFTSKINGVYHLNIISSLPMSDEIGLIWIKNTYLHEVVCVVAEVVQRFIV